MNIPNFKTEKLVDLLLDQNWHKECEIIPDYMPPYPNSNTKPIVVVKYPNKHEGVFLRYSNWPIQSLFWDVYGEDMHSIEVAILALSKAPIPLNYRKAEYPLKFKINLNEKKDT